MPDRAHVPGRGPPARGPPDDPGRHPGRGGARPRGAACGPEVRLPRDPRGHGRAAGHHPAPRPPAARVPARHHGAGHQGGDGRPDRGGVPALRRGQAVARVQPDAGHPGGPARGDQARALRHAGAGPHGGGPRPGAGWGPSRGGDHDPPDRVPGGAGARPLLGGGRHRRRPGRGGPAEEGPGVDERHPRGPDRHHDRDAAGGAGGRRDRRGGRLLLLRHQRPDPDDLRIQPGRRRGPDDVGLPGGGPAEAEPLRGGRPGRCGRAGPAGHRPGPGHPAGPQGRRVRRARGRSRVDRHVRGGRPRLRELLALPGAHRPPGRRPGRHRRPHRGPGPGHRGRSAGQAGPHQEGRRPR